MSRSLNRVTFIGNVGADPELRSTPSGAKVAQLSLATSERWTDRNGVKQERTEWHRLVVWNRGAGKLAEIVAEHVRKGARLYVEASVHHRKWEDKDGQTRYSTEFAVREVIFLDGSRTAAPGSRASSQSTGVARDGRTGPGETGGDDFDDFPGGLDEDIPF